MKKLRITVEGKAYDVLVEMLDSTPATAASPPVSSSAPAPAVALPAPAPVSAPLSSPGAGGPGDVISPLAGKVVSIDVALSQSVAEGAQVATMEAMKMNTYLYAPKAGVVAAILVTPGDGVEEGSVVLRIG